MAHGLRSRRDRCGRAGACRRQVGRGQEGGTGGRRPRGRRTARLRGRRPTRARVLARSGAREGRAGDVQREPFAARLWAGLQMRARRSAVQLPMTSPREELTKAEARVAQLRAEIEALEERLLKPK